MVNNCVMYIRQLSTSEKSDTAASAAVSTHLQSSSATLLNTAGQLKSATSLASPTAASARSALHCLYCNLTCRSSVITDIGWWSCMLALINEDNLCLARLVLRWATVSGFNSWCRTFIAVCNQPATQANSAFYPSGVGI